jgi:hypothetical protein
MRGLCLIVLFALAAIPRTGAQVVLHQEPPQTARQALLEMLTGTPEMFEKHLLDATKKALLQGEDSASSPIFHQFAAFRAEMSATRNHVQTFESGSTLISMDEADGQLKFEIDVERDDLISDVNEIEVSFRSYKAGVMEALPVVPRLTLSMKQEKEVWKLNEITLALRVPLGDPDYLGGLQKSQRQASESSAVANIRTLNTAEISYAAAFPARGFTCNLSELGGQYTGSEQEPEHAMLIDDALASGKKNGYVFAINNCDVRPASQYQVTASPADPDSGTRAFCSDESAIVRYSADGKAATCLSEGVPLQ